MTDSNDSTPGGIANLPRTITDLGMETAESHSTMSSREIAELCDKRHDNVMRDARAMLVELHGEANALTFEGVYLGGNGEERPCLNLPKRETLILVSGYKLTLRAKIIDRWQELEARSIAPQPATLSRMDLIRLAYEAEKELEATREQVVALEHKMEEVAPKVAFAEQVAAAEDCISTGEAAKLLGTGRTRLMDFLRKVGWVNRLNEPYQAKVEAGLLNVKVTSFEHPREGLKKRVTPMVTGKGLAKLHRIYQPVTA